MKWTNLRIERKQAGIVRQKELADASGFNRETIAAIENGSLGVDRETQDRIREAIKTLAASREEEKAAA